MYFNPNIPPPNGIRFLNNDGTKITANTWERLERKVIEYRKQIGGKTDGVWDEIVAQVCAGSPGFCRDESGRAVAEAKVRENVKARVMQWLGKTANLARQKRLPKVSDARAKERARACMACPKRQQTDVGCAGCRNNVDNLRKVVLNNQNSVSNGLGGCDVTGEDLASAIHLKLDVLPPDNLPDYCWRRKP